MNQFRIRTASSVSMRQLQYSQTNIQAFKVLLSSSKPRQYSQHSRKLTRNLLWKQMNQALRHSMKSIKITLQYCKWLNQLSRAKVKSQMQVGLCGHHRRLTIRLQHQLSRQKRKPQNSQFSLRKHRYRDCENNFNSR